jgi:hypothetical protein
MIYKFYALAGLSLEIIAVRILYLSLGTAPKLAVFFIVHALASYLASVALWRELPGNFQSPRKQTIMFFTTFSCFIPVLGIIGIALSSLFCVHFYKENKEFDIHSITTPPYMSEARVYLSQFGEGGARARLVNAGSPKRQKMTALLAMEAVSGRSSNEVLRIAMQDNDDEVRLLAFGMLDSRENVLNSRIHELMRSLDDPKKEVAEIAEIHRNLAMLFWELVYQELARDSLMEYATEKALHHALKTAEILPDDSGNQVLIGRILMHRKEYNAARHAFWRAKDLGIPVSRVIPYLAEIAYLECDYGTVRDLLASDTSFFSIPVLAQVAAFWGDAS